MAVYGKFETVEPVFRTLHGSIWTARMVGSGDSPDCCVKLVELNQTMLSQRDTSLAKNLLVSSALQQAMGNKSEFWAPVYGLGSQGTNAFYATRFFARSLQTLIDNRTALTASELKIILLSIVDGLIDLETAVGRSHFNLKPSNVLLDDADQIRPSSIFLCDPDPTPDDTASSTRTPDAKAVGQLLYALVTHKPYFTARWPLPATEHWKQLGSTGKQWRTLCENLLHLGGKRGLPTIETLRERIDGIQPTRRRTPVAALISLACIAALGAACYLNRDQLPGWYHMASNKVVALISNKKVASSSHSTIASASVPPNGASSHSSDRQGANASAMLASQLQSPADQQRFIAAAWNPQPPATEPTAVSTLMPVTPSLVTPVPMTPLPMTGVPVVVSSPPATMPSENAAALRVVQQTQPPEFHSDAAKEEFVRSRDEYVTAHTDTPSVALLLDWEKVRAELQGADSDYPALDPVATVGWPKGLAAVISARRDSMLVQAVDSAFLKQHTDPANYQDTVRRVQLAGNAVVVAHDALARGDVTGSEKAIAQCNDVVRDFPATDADLADLFAPSKKEFNELDDVENIADRATLLQIADNENASLAVRLSAWTHAGSVSLDPWPTDFITLAGDQARADRLNTLLQEAGSVEIARQVAGTEANRQTGFFSRLRDQSSVLAAAKQANDPQYSALLVKAPVWFRYDAALYVLQNTLPAEVTAEQKKNYMDLSGQVDAPDLQLVHDVLKESDEHPPTLAQSGPGVLKDWQLRAGWTRDRCTYISTITGDSLEFLRVHLFSDPKAADCFLCTTETPLSLMQHLLKGDSSALEAAETLNTPINVPKPGMRLWSFNDKDASVDLNEDDYRKCFVVSPSDQLPVQMITPQAAFYLARRVGCRLPTAREWTAALNQAKTSTDDNTKGFATLGWKLRDKAFARLLSDPNRDADCWPDDNIFLGNLNPATVQRQTEARIWSVAALANLGGTTPSESSGSTAAWPLSTLESSSAFGFRDVGDIENYAGVFHDLIGNVGEYVMDTPVVLAEKIAVAPPMSSADAAHHVTDWFTSKHLAAVSVIGGSAVSPPELDPTKSYPLPKDANQFADVGFRLCFTDPASMPVALREVIGQAIFLTAP